MPLALRELSGPSIHLKGRSEGHGSIVGCCWAVAGWFTSVAPARSSTVPAVGCIPWLQAAPPEHRGLSGSSAR
jgi:hypothetical protein